MNILFLLTPKNEVAYVYSDNTFRQALEKMKYYTYTAIPVLSREGAYRGTVTEGDFLWKLLQERDAPHANWEQVRVEDILREDYNLPVNVNAKMDDLLVKATNQNFVPVVDDRDMFIGIITRRDILQYYRNLDTQK